MSNETFQKSNGSSRANRENGNGGRRRAELADFLRRRRASIQPEDVGLPSGGRRRTPGLRREEVASLAGVGTTWYTWLEQGRDVRASLDVFEAIAKALRLTPAERTHLILLGRGEEAPACKPPAERVSPTLRRLVENLGPNPAMVLGRRWDYLAWNRAACVVFGDIGAIPKAARNHLWQLFMDPGRRELFAEWEQSSRRPLLRGTDPSAQAGEPRLLQGVEAPRGRARGRGHQDAEPPGGRQAAVRARGVPAG
jgi:transcriptional regulator with XRE-family HTH domain